MGVLSVAMKMCKSLLFALPAVLGVAQAEPLSWHYNIPETGVMPAAFTASVTSPMSTRHGDGSLALNQMRVCTPLSDPRRSDIEGWHVYFALDMERTELQNHTALPTEHSVFYDIAAPLAFIRTFADETRLTLTFSPHVAGDLSNSARSFEPAGYVDYRFYNTEKLTLSAGLAITPAHSETWVIPFVCVEWDMPQDWHLHIKGVEMTLLHPVWREGHAAGIFARAVGGAWAAEMQDDSSRLLRVRSFATGLRWQYTNAPTSETRALFFAEIGSALITRACVSRWDDRDDYEESRFYNPGLYLSAGVDLRF